MFRKLSLIALVAIPFLWFGCDNKEDTPEDTQDKTFSLLLIANNEKDVVLTPKLVWEQLEGDAITYTVYLDRSAELGSDEEPKSEIVTDLTQNFHTIASNLVLATEYKWRVEAKDKEGIVTKSTEVFTFTTTADIAANRPPNDFNLLQPIDGFQDAPLTVSFSWETSVDPDGHEVTYDMYLGKNPNPNTLVLFSDKATSFTYPNDLEYGTTYYWWVQAIDQKGGFKNSQVFSFKTIKDPNAPAPFTIKKVANPQLPANIFGRYGHELVVKDDKIWMIGGMETGTLDPGRKNDVFSYDGNLWTEVKPHDDDQLKSFLASDESQVVVFNDKFYVFVGTRNQISESSDGVNWSTVQVSGKVQDTTHWKGKHGHQVLVFKDKMWVLGGTNGGVPSDHVWSSSNGVDWEPTNVYGNNGFGPRISHAAFVLDGKMWVHGGVNQGAEIWSSTDGVDWKVEVSDPPFGLRSEHEFITFDDLDLVIMIGHRTKNDVWYSIDGINWIEYPSGLLGEDFKARTEYDMVVYKDKVWVISGKHGALGLDDVWQIE